MTSIIIVGSGIFGSVIARHLAEGGASVTVIDDARPDRGSAPAGCVIKPSWVSSLDSSEFNDSLSLLQDLYGVQTVEFELRPSGKKVSAYRVEPRAILRGFSGARYITGEAHSVESEIHRGIIHFKNDLLIGPDLLGADHVVVAAGLWTPELCPWIETWGRWGWSFRGPPVEQPVISLWAPYRQVVALNLDDGRSWSGDGSALKLSSADKPGALASARERCREVLGGGELQFIRGVRPYAKLPDRAPCLVSRRGRIWAVTGGAKNGTIAAAWAARLLEKEMRL